MNLITGIIILILLATTLVMYFKYKAANEKNKLNDVTNSLLRLNLSKKEIDEKIKNSSISDLVNARNNSGSAKSSTGDGA